MKRKEKIITGLTKAFCRIKFPPMNKIYVIATETQYGYEEGTDDPILVTEVCSQLGFWERESDAQSECISMNIDYVPEDDSDAGSPFFALAIDRAES